MQQERLAQQRGINAGFNCLRLGCCSCVMAAMLRRVDEWVVHAYSLHHCVLPLAWQQYVDVLLPTILQGLCAACIRSHQLPIVGSLTCNTPFALVMCTSGLPWVA